MYKKWGRGRDGGAIGFVPVLIQVLIKINLLTPAGGHHWPSYTESPLSGDSGTHGWKSRPSSLCGSSELHKKEQKNL